jgi:hypothetical protein
VFEFFGPSVLRCFISDEAHRPEHSGPDTEKMNP